ncbi:MAG: TAXI family TRAP transporter solute-binding subunit [Deltaproteobacteria bacterium]|nr:TAXI family TRAP transporter solute-binding subunit [Deltaproteobacteria bacterium]
MKKSLVICLVIALGLSIASSASAGKENWPKALAFGTGSVGGSAYPACMAYAYVVTKYLGVPATCETSGGSINNTKLVHMKKLLMGHTAQGASWNGFHGKTWAKGKKYNNIRAAYAIYPQLWHGWTLSKYNITKLSDLNGKVVSGGPRGGTSDAYTQWILKELGIKPKRYVYAGFGDTVGMLRDGHIHAAFASTAVPMPAANEVTSTLNGVILGFDDKEQQKKAADAFPYLPGYTLPAGVYKGQDKPVLVNADWVVISVNKEVDEDFVYNVVKVVMEHNKELVAGHKALKNAVPENSKYIMLPLHKGAYRYFKEKGIEVPKAAMPID